MGNDQKPNIALLEKLLYPMTCQEFFDDYWQKKGLHISRNDINYYKPLTQKAVDNWLQTATLTFPNVNLFNPKTGRTRGEGFVKPIGLPGKKGQLIDRNALLQKFHEGSSIIINYFSHEIPSLNKYTTELSKIFRAKVEDYLVVSSSNKDAFNIHGDGFETFVLHVSGQKQWRFYDTISKNLRQEHVQYLMDKKPSKEFIMQPGDFLYIPMQLRHGTHAIGDEPSISLTITIDLLDGEDLIRKVLKDTFVSFPSIRKQVPSYNWSTSESREAYYKELKELFIAQLNEVNLEEVFEELLQKEEKQSTSIDIFKGFNPHEKVTLESEVMNAELPFNLQVDGKCVRLKIPHHVFTYFKTLEFTLKYLTSQKVFKVKDLPGMLNDEMRIKIVQELVDKGFLKLT